MSSHRRPSRTPKVARSRFELAVHEPFRLDLTASALRRVPTNVVDLLTPAGEYVHAFAAPHGPMIARVAPVSYTHLTLPTN